MRQNQQKVVACGLAWLLFAAFGETSTLAAGDSSISAGACSVAAGRHATNNSLTCIFGLTPEQLKQAIEAAVKGATEPLVRSERSARHSM